MPVIDEQLIIKVIAFFIPFLFSLCFHEYAHGWMAKRFGDNTAEVMGRLTLNPMAHVDWLGTVMLPIASIVTGLPLFGWAKPVPVNARNFDKPRQQMFWVALAGPLSNILLFILGLVAVYIIDRQSYFQPTALMKDMILTFLGLNLFLAFFNLLPIHPLDGGKVIARFLPPRLELWLEERQEFAQIILLLLVIFGILKILSYPVLWVLCSSLNFVGSL